MADAITHYKQAEKHIEEFHYQNHRIGELEGELDLTPAESRELEALWRTKGSRLMLAQIHATLATTKYTDMDTDRPFRVVA